MFLICGFLLPFLSSCTLAPSYCEPELPVANNYPYEQEEGLDALEIPWCEFFRDPRLQELISIALTNNRDLRIAIFNVEQARLQYDVIRRDLLPSAEINATGSKQRTVTVRQGVTGSQTATTSQIFSIDAVVNWELDLFGRITSLSQQALEEYLATNEAERAIHLSLVAEVAIQYVLWLSLEEQLAVSLSTLESNRIYYELFKKRFQTGIVSELDLALAETLMDSAQADVAMYQKLAEQAQNALVFLIGQPFPEDLPPPKPLGDQTILTDLRSGLPSELLERRPDIMEAEHIIKAANANIGVARANFFPRISLTGRAGTASTALRGLFGPDSGIWGLTGEIIQPIFNRTANITTLQLAYVNKEIAIANYERVVQIAFREVADALVGREYNALQLESQQELTDAEDRRYALTEQRYKRGLDSFLAVLLAQNDRYGARQNLIQVEFLKYANLITLYKVLGGGWSCESADPTR